MKVLEFKRGDICKIMSYGALGILNENNYPIPGVQKISTSFKNDMAIVLRYVLYEDREGIIVVIVKGHLGWLFMNEVEIVD